MRNNFSTTSPLRPGIALYSRLGSRIKDSSSENIFKSAAWRARCASYCPVENGLKAHKGWREDCIPSISRRANMFGSMSAKSGIMLFNPAAVTPGYLSKW